MTSIEDFLQPLHEGIWEVKIQKDQVSKPLGSDWVTSPVNIPTPGTIASYRNGQYHLHETSTEFRVHLDRYDPVHHPIMHLVDDAPLLLMISETFITLISFTRRAVNSSVAEQLQQQTTTFRNHLIMGVLIIIFGACFLLLPDLIFYGVTALIIPVIVFFAGLITLLEGFSFRPVKMTDRNEAIRGGCIILISLVLTAIPARLWSICILIVITIWMFASALILFKRIIHGRKAVPEGFFSRLLIGAGSLILGVFSFLAPAQVFYFLLDILGIMTMILGGSITLLGIRLRELMRETLKQEPDSG
jgi:hypothetical protein